MAFLHVPHPPTTVMLFTYWTEQPGGNTCKATAVQTGSPGDNHGFVLKCMFWLEHDTMVRDSLPGLVIYLHCAVRIIYDNVT